MDEILIWDGSLNDANKKIPLMHKEITRLTKKVDTLSNALGHGQLDWDGSLEDAEEQLKQLLPDLSSENYQICQKAQVKFDILDKLIRNHPDFIKREELKWKQWEADELQNNQKALTEMKSIVPKEVLTGLDKDFLMNKKGLTEAVANRVMNSKIFKFLYLDKDTISKTHSADLASRYVFQGLDIIELRAIYICLPSEFLNDADGSKKMWKENFRSKLAQWTIKEKAGSLSNNEKRHPAYTNLGTRPVPSVSVGGPARKPSDNLLKVLGGGKQPAPTALEPMKRVLSLKLNGAPVPKAVQKSNEEAENSESDFLLQILRKGKTNLPEKNVAFPVVLPKALSNAATQYVELAKISTNRAQVNDSVSQQSEQLGGYGEKVLNVITFLYLHLILLIIYLTHGIRWLQRKLNEEKNNPIKKTMKKN